MTNDTERREVARRLREIADGYEEVSYFDLVRTLGLGAVSRYGYDPDDVRRLADLIEPSGHECVPGECPINVRHDNDKIDRDALLEEVQELERCASYFGLDFDEDEPLRDRLEEASEDFAGSADRIRKALGGGAVSEFVLTGSDVFGRYCRIEQLRFGVPNELFLYKVVASMRSNCWCEVPYKTASKEVRHDSIEDCVLAICCGVDETKVLRFRVADVEFVSSPICDRDALLALADEMDAHWLGHEGMEDSPVARWSRELREALGEAE